MTQPAPITITYWEGDTTFTKLYYCEWTCGTKSYYAHADESQFPDEADEDADEYEDSAGNWEHRGIPYEVRRALAELIFPPLKGYSFE